MSEIIIGPFNRVEGDLEVRLDVQDGVVASARVVAPLYRGFEQILVGRPATDGLVIAPRICGICSVSQSMAAAAALRAVSGVAVPENGLLAASLAHAAENLADHLTHFYLFFMPDFARDTYAGRPWHEDAVRRFRAVTGEAASAFLPVRSRLLNVLGLIAGKWPHSLALQPGGTTRALDLGEKMRLVSVLADVRAFLEQELFGRPLEEIAEGGLADRESWVTGGDFGRFLQISEDLELHRLGLGRTPLMSVGAYELPDGPVWRSGLWTEGGIAPLAAAAITEDVAGSWFAGDAEAPGRASTQPDLDRAGGYSFAKAPRHAGAPVEVGAIARQAVAGNGLVRALMARDGGTSVAARVVARLVEAAQLGLLMEGWARALKPSAPFFVPTVLPESGEAVGFTEAARGSLGHWLTVEEGRIARYQIIAPTTWNFSPRDAEGIPGPLEQALEGLEVGVEGARSVAVQHIVRSFDPCMVCTAH
jgi:hydrogenase large subunit